LLNLRSSGGGVVEWSGGVEVWWRCGVVEWCGGVVEWWRELRSA
jgi:hypothetical protein